MAIDNTDRGVKLGKFVSLILRHRPDMLGLDKLEPGGWVDVELLIKKVNEQNHRLTRDDLDQLVRENNKQRYSYDYSKKKIRANQGHSVEVDLQLEPAVPPGVLFHGTTEKSLNAILEEGIKKMYRHAVHLSKEKSTAQDVGGRRGKAVVLHVHASRMHDDGYVFYQSDNGVWLTESVPTQYIELPTAHKAS